MLKSVSIVLNFLTQMRTGYQTFDHGNLISHNDGSSSSQVAFSKASRTSLSQLPLPPINALLEIQRSKSQQQAFHPDTPHLPDVPSQAFPPGAESSNSPSQPQYALIRPPPNQTHVNGNLESMASLGLLETRSLSERITNMERFLLSELDRVRESVRHFETTIQQESMRREHLEHEQTTLSVQLATLAQTTSTQSHPIPAHPPAPPQQLQPLTPSDILALIHPTASRLEALATRIAAIEARMGHFENAAAVHAAEARAQVVGVQRDAGLHAEVAREVIAEAVAKMHGDVVSEVDAASKVAEVTRVRNDGLVEALRVRVDTLERDAQERQARSDGDLMLLLEGIKNIKEAMMSLGKGQSEKRVSDDYKAELRMLRDELSTSLREVKDDFKRRLLSMSRLASVEFPP
ncbi:hypothetical protein BC830DRAFT_1141993 [Chytriomyces sp. MP71]|nr:hypothetical protein BC830DRAFT_1141993 [Chytriomyces sp. MP71]